MTTGTKIKLDIACGQSKQEGFHGVDIAATEDADTVHDLRRYPWPFADDSVEEAFCSHYVEHIPFDVIRNGQATDGLCAFMNECFRVMEDGAQIRIVHPYLKNNRAFQDPTHRRFIPEETWHYFNREWREANKLDHYPIDCHFEVTGMHMIFQPPWNLRAPDAQQFALASYWNVAADLVVDLTARKT